MTDVVVIGEPLVEFAGDSALADGAPLRLGFSGDALNTAAAAAAAGAQTALLARVAADELGDALVSFAAGLGIDVSHVARVPAPQGAYLVRADATGDRQFCYLRRGSAGSTLQPADLSLLDQARPRAVLSSGITWAISDSAAATVRLAARMTADRGGLFVYDPNYRPRLTSAQAAAAAVRALMPMTSLVTPSCPVETVALLGTDDPRTAADTLLSLGATAAVITQGAQGVSVHDGTFREYPAVPAPLVVDQTGAGDCFTGTMTARLSLGDPLDRAVEAALAAAAAAVSATGALGHLRGEPPREIARATAERPLIC
jgi:2-dehydro-3-deoxygluconokinase